MSLYARVADKLVSSDNSSRVDTIRKIDGLLERILAINGLAVELAAASASASGTEEEGKTVAAGAALAAGDGKAASGSAGSAAGAADGSAQKAAATTSAGAAAGDDKSDAKPAATLSDAKPAAALSAAVMKRTESEGKTTATLTGTHAADVLEFVGDTHAHFGEFRCLGNGWCVTGLLFPSLLGMLFACWCDLGLREGLLGFPS